jgi:cyclin-dependent kinase 12/13
MVYLHDNHIIHRDVKGANILIDKNGIVKLADFGLARVIYPDIRKINYTIKVVTLWYRAPELLLGLKNYSDKVDIWSLGCFFAELFIGKTLFPGDNERRELELIFDVCGSPSPKKFKNYKHLKPTVRDEIEKKKHKRRLEEFLREKNFNRKMDESLIDLLSKMLTVEPNLRISGREALAHPYFTEDPLPCDP